jgi:hypothetical protein
VSKTLRRTASEGKCDPILSHGFSVAE